MKSEVYNQSVCLMSEVAYRYYMQGKSGTEIADELEISRSTVSRLLKKAQKENLISFKMKDPYETCIRMQKELKNLFQLTNVVIVPFEKPEKDINHNEIKKMVGLEGARYIQRIIREGDTVGLAWGRTMYHMIHFLNPCRRLKANIVTLHGSLELFGSELAVDKLVRRAAMAFGGKSYSIQENGLCESREQLLEIKNKEENAYIFDMFQDVDIAVSGVGAFGDNPTSLLAGTEYLTNEELETLKEKQVVADFMLRFFDKHGNECDMDLKERTLSIEKETFCQIPTKIVLASGSSKAKALRAVLEGGMADVIVIDCFLGAELMRLIEQDV